MQGRGHIVAQLVSSHIFSKLDYLDLIVLGLFLMKDKVICELITCRHNNNNNNNNTSICKAHNVSIRAESEALSQMSGFYFFKFVDTNILNANLTEIMRRENVGCLRADGGRYFFFKS